MIALILVSTLTATSPTDLDARINALSNAPGVACYTVAKARRSTPIRENYFTYSEVVGTIKRGQYFFGQRVASENKVLVHSPNAVGAIGIARHTFTRSVPTSKCLTARSLVAPSAAELKGWGRPLPGQAALPKPPAGPASNYGSHGCYRNKRTGETFWGSLVERETGGYARRVRVIGKDGQEVRQEPTRRLERLALSQCGPV